MQPSAVDLAGSPPIESPEFWARPFRVPASPDSDTATAQTIEIMAGHVRAAARDRLVQETARRALDQFGGLASAGAGGTDGGIRSPEVTARAIAGAAFWWCKVYVRFVHHEFIIRQRLGESGHLQGLISPDVLVRMNNPEGDCAIFSECVAAFLTALGVPCEFVTVAVNPNEPQIFSHVYLYAVMPDGSRLPLDASHGLYPGWQVPSSDVSRRQVWDASGNPVADRGSRFDGLHNYGMRQGLGDVCNPMDADYDYNFCVSQAAALGQEPAIDTGAAFVDYTTGQPYSGTTYTAPSQNSAQWASFASSLAKMGFDLAKINAIQPGTVVSANGAILRQNPGYAVGTSTGITANLGMSTTTLVIGGLGLLAVLFLFSGKGR